MKAKHECRTHGAVYSIDISRHRVEARVTLPATASIRDGRAMCQRVHDALEDALAIAFPGAAEASRHIKRKG